MATEGIVNPETATAPAPAGRRAFAQAIEQYGLLILLVLLVAVFAFTPESSEAFVSLPNIRQLLINQAVTALIALAMVVPLVAGYFDLSVSAIAGASSITFAQLVGPVGWPIWASILTALLVSLLLGVVNGIFVAYIRLNGFIVTLGTFILIQGLLQWFTGGQTIFQGIPDSVTKWGTQDFIGIPYPFLLLVIVALAIWYFLMHVPKGRELESIGSNERAARLVGIRVSRNVFYTFLTSAFIAGIAGILITSRAGSADPTSGPGYLFPALAAVFLGATCIRPGKYNVWGTIIGVYLLAVAVNGFTLLGADPWVTPVFNGLALVVAVLVSTLMARSRATK